MNKRPELIMASYVTYKELYKCDKYRSPYQILAEFVKYTIYEEKLYRFSTAEMKKRIKDAFGFELPNAVLKSTLKKVDCIEKISGHDEYCVDYNKITLDSEFEVFKKTAEQDNSELIEKLIEFVEMKTKNILEDNEKQKLSMEFMAYLLDESNGGKYQDIISTFILKLSQNEEYSKQLQSIREGCILYTGINYNIDEIGSITDELVLYLDMEVLFDLYGYNGEVFQSLAQDMIKLIQEANKRKKYIKLRYFCETKKEIEDFFLKAEEIVSGRVLLRENVAMKSITDGCNDITDVIERQTDFFHTMNFKYGILEDGEKNYYTQEQHEANLEGINIAGINLEQAGVELSIKFVSNINKLRKNQLYSDYLKSKYIFVTETWRTLEVSKKVMEMIQDEHNDKNYANFAVNMSFITNLLWYKMNRGFGVNELPQNINAVIKAKIVLSNYISQNVAYTYEEYKKQFDNGDITAEQFAARLVALKNKNVRPEEITIDSVEDDLNFDSENLKRFEEESLWQKEQLKEKNREIEELKENQSKTILKIESMQKELDESKSQQKRQDEALQKQEKIIEEQSNIIIQQKEVIENFNQQRLISEQERVKKKKVKKFIQQILIRMMLLVILCISSYYLARAVNADMANSLSIIVGIVGIAISIVDVIKNVYKKIFL